MATGTFTYNSKRAITLKTPLKRHRKALKTSKKKTRLHGQFRYYKVEFRRDVHVFVPYLILQGSVVQCGAAIFFCMVDSNKP